ncbi:hypothetical protein EsH8_IX_000231 [Colletotrichum jinshuiense]
MSENTNPTMENSSKRNADESINPPAKRLMKLSIGQSVNQVNQVNTQLADQSKDSSSSQAAKTIEIPVVSDAYSYIQRETHHVVAKMAVYSKHYQTKGVPPKELYERLELFFLWLETRSWGPSHLCKKSRDRLAGTFKLLTDPNGREDQQRFFTEDTQTRAKALAFKWTDQDAALFVDDVDDNEGAVNALEDESVKNKTSFLPKVPTATKVKTVTYRLPALNDPIFGIDGPMCGIAYKQGKTKTYEQNPDFSHLKKFAGVFGHNGLTVGDWWPMQVAAFFKGAHGSWQGGISGHAAQGAHSIVTSGTYEECDKDDGTILYYSGSGSHEHTDNEPKVTNATKLLHTSLRTQKPVRVLRSASGGKGKWRPSVGIRYDGLYRVHEVLTPTNKKGGRYFQFVLWRLEDQGDFLDLTAIPNNHQKAQYEAVKLGY